MASISGLRGGLLGRRLARLASSSVAEDASQLASPVAAPKKEMSSAMKFYLKKKRENDLFIAKERSEFELGKKHLANMMGMTYETMTQDDVDRAVGYLFPSGLTFKDARPHLKPPEEVTTFM